MPTLLTSVNPVLLRPWASAEENVLMPTHTRRPVQNTNLPKPGRPRSALEAPTTNSASESWTSTQDNFLMSTLKSCPAFHMDRSESTPQPLATPLTHTSAGPWTSAEDQVLVSARRNGLGWSQIHEKYFPLKSANACRKRYERLVHKQKSDDWDEARLGRLAFGYCNLREEIWRPLAERTGEKWEHVEKAVSLNPKLGQSLLTVSSAWLKVHETCKTLHPKDRFD